MANARANILVTAEDRTKAAFDSVARSMDQLKKIGAAVLGGAFVKEAIESGRAAEESANRLTAAYKLQAGQVGITREQLDEMADSLAAATQFNDNDIKRGEAELLKFGNIYGDVFKSALSLSADLAAFNGTDLATATDALGKALANPTEGVKGLGAAVGKLSAEQRDHIKTLAEQNKALEAQNYILDLVKAHIGGTAAQMNTGYTKAIEDTAKAWDKFKEALAGIAIIKDTVTGALDAIAASLRGVASVFQGGTFSEGVLGKQTAMAKQIMDMKDQISVAEKRQGLTFTDDEGRVIGEDLRLDQLKKKLQELEAEYTKLYQTQAEGPKKAGKPNFGMTPEQLAFIKSLREQTERVGEGGPIAGLFAKADELHLGDKTHAMIQKLGQAIQQEADQADLARDRLEGWKAAFGFGESQRQALSDLQLQTANLTRYREDAELATEAQKIDNEIRKVSITLLDDQKDAFLQNAKALKRDYLEAFEANQEAQRKWQTGFAQAMNNVTDYATNTAEQVKTLFADAFRSMEDAMVSFVKTGKLDFKSLADSIITQIIRIRIEQSIIAPMAAALSGSAGTNFVGSALSFFGIRNSPGGTVEVGAGTYGASAGNWVPQARAGGGDISANEPYWVGEQGPELVVPRSSGTVIPHGQSMGGGSVHIESISIGQGASPESVQEAFRQIRDLKASVGPIALATVQQARQRGAAGLR